VPKQKVTTLSQESIERFRSTLSAKAKSTHTVKAYCTDLRMFLRDLEDTESPSVEMESEFEELGMAWLTKNRRTLAPKTTARRLTSLRAFAAWAGYPEFLEDYSAPDAGVPIPHPLPEGMNGVRRMVAATSNERQQALIALCGMVGLRVAEALNVHYKDFNFQGTNTILTVCGKGEVTRHVPVSAEAFDYLVRPIARSMSSNEPVVPLKDRFARRVITEVATKAKLSRRVASHDLRATFATSVYNKTKDQRLVQILLGHKSGRTTEGYIGIEVQAMIEGVQDL